MTQETLDEVAYTIVQGHDSTTVIYLEEGGSAVEMYDNKENLPNDIKSYEDLIKEDDKLTAVVVSTLNVDGSKNEFIIKEGEEGFEEHKADYIETQAKIQYEQLCSVEYLLRHVEKDSNGNYVADNIVRRVFDMNNKTLTISTYNLFNTSEGIIIQRVTREGKTNYWVDQGGDGTIDHFLSDDVSFSVINDKVHDIYGNLYDGINGNLRTDFDKSDEY